jgi:hypothetical protein
VSRDQLKNPFKVLSVGALAVGLATAGLSACSPAPQTLACTTIVSVVQSSTGLPTGVVTVKTAPGAKVLVVANYISFSVSRKLTTNATGLTHATFDLSLPFPGKKIDVAAVGIKGNRSGACSAAFTKTTGTTESNQPGTKPTPSLKSTVQADWLIPAGNQLPYNTHSPDGSCSTPRPGTGDTCGTVVFNSTVTGFKAFGGTPTCADGTNTCPPPYSTEAHLTGTATLSWTLSCTVNGVTTLNKGSATRELTNAWQSSLSYVSPQTRVDSDTAKLRLVTDLPFASDIAKCAGPSTLVSVSATGIQTHLEHSATTYPEANFISAGPYSYTATPTS